jgi:hypothetical protein
MARKAVTITLYKSEQLYDIMNKTYLTGESRKTFNDDGTQANSEEIANMKASEDSGPQEQLLGSMKDAYNYLKVQLSDYIDETTVASNNELMDDTGNLLLTLSLPSNFNSASTDAIATKANAYIVNKSLAAWFILTAPKEAEVYEALAKENLKDLNEAINKRVRPTRTSV